MLKANGENYLKGLLRPNKSMMVVDPREKSKIYFKIYLLRELHN